LHDASYVSSARSTAVFVSPRNLVLEESMRNVNTLSRIARVEKLSFAYTLWRHHHELRNLIPRPTYPISFHQYRIYMYTQDRDWTNTGALACFICAFAKECA